MVFLDALPQATWTRQTIMCRAICNVLLYYAHLLVVIHSILLTQCLAMVSCQMIIAFKLVDPCSVSLMLRVPLVGVLQ